MTTIARSGPAAANAEGRRIGLLGGSFNPAHEGHLHISRQALRRLKLDVVWWVVSPQNPLKPTAGMAPFEERFASAARVAAAEPRIVVSDIERTLGTRFSIDTVESLKATHPDTRFVWVMGADNLLQAPRWTNDRSLRPLPTCTTPLRFPLRCNLDQYATCTASF